MSQIRLSYTFNQPVVQGYSNIRISFTYNQPLVDGYPQVRLSYAFSQPLVDAYSKIRLSYVFCQSLFPAPPELPMSTTPFPGFGNSTTIPSIPAAKDPFNTPLPGLTYSVHKKPMFKTKVTEAASGVEVRTSLTPYPRWDFEFQYDFLEDRSGGESSLKTIMGFFMTMRGSYDTFLLKDPDDYLVEFGTCGSSDGTTTEFPFCRTMNGFQEKVCQVDTANDINVYVATTDTTTIPAMGPYIVTVPHTTFYADGGVLKGGIPMTKVTGAPGAGEYSVTDGVYTFNGFNSGSAIVISYTYLVSPSDYNVVLPNLIEFVSAPPAGTVYADFQFYFACRFADDQQDFEKFADQLWNLQSCNFRSVIQ